MPSVQVFHIEKRGTIPGGLNRHITRVQWVDGKLVVWIPDNANPELTKDNVELVSREFTNSAGKVINLSLQEAVNKRIKEAGIKPRKGQSRCLEMIFSGSHEVMCNMSREELLKWADDTLKWAQKTWGKENVVSASLHVDEKTPHIHMIVVPIVQGQSRRSKKQKELDKERGIKRGTYKINTEKLRLCANEVYTTPLLYYYHDHYALEVSSKYGLERGLRAEPGSKKKHQTSEDYNRQLAAETAEKQSLIAEIQSDYRKAYKRKEDIESEVKNLESKSSSLSGEITTKEKRVSQLQGAIDHNVKVIHKQFSDFNARKQQIDEQEGLIKENSDTISSQQEDIDDIRQFLNLFKDAERKAEQKENYLKSISSMGLLKMIQSIPELIKADVQEKVKGYWKGTVQSFEKVRYPIEDREEDFIKVNMRNNETNHDYFFELRIETGNVYYNGNLVKWPKTGETMYMSSLASYFKDEINSEAMQIVESLYKHPAQTNEVVWNCSLGLEKTRIIHREDGKYELQQQQYNQGKFVWSEITAFKSFKEIGKDNTYAFLKVTHLNGQEEYINQYGNNLTGKQLKSLGIKSGNGIGL